MIPHTMKHHGYLRTLTGPLGVCCKIGSEKQAKWVLFYVPFIGRRPELTLETCKSDSCLTHETESYLQIKTEVWKTRLLSWGGVVVGCGVREFSWTQFFLLGDSLLLICFLHMSQFMKKIEAYFKKEKELPNAVMVQQWRQWCIRPSTKVQFPWRH